MLKYILVVLLLLLWFTGLQAQTSTDLKLSYEINYGQVVYDNFVICNDGEPPFNFQLKNETTHSGFVAFKLKLGDSANTEVEMSDPGSNKTLTYRETGTFTLQFIGVTTSGSEIVREYSLKIVGKLNVSLLREDEKVKCLGSDVYYQIEVKAGGTDGTVYYLNYDDGSALDQLDARDLKEGKGTFRHKYTRSYCDIPGHTEQAFKVALTYQNECYSGEATTVSEYVAVPFEVQYTFSHLSDNKVCTYEKLTLRNLTTGGTGSDCTLSKPIPLWDFGNGKTSEDWEPYVLYTDKDKEIYNIKLKVSNNYACATDSVSYPVELYNRTVALLEVLKDTICAGEKVQFYNHSTGDEISSHWSVVPLDGTPVSPYVENAISPEIQFDHWGCYKVRLFVTNVCSESETDTVIIVKQNPEIVRYDLPGEICQSDLVDMSRYITIFWNGNEEKATWTITRKGAVPNTDFECTQGDLQSAYPVIHFLTPGIYTVTLELQDVGCQKIKLKDSKEIVVHDPEIHIAIDTTPLNICEKSAVSFTNHSTGEDLRYEWSVKPSNNVSFINNSKADAASVTLQFDRYGDYTVNLHTYTKSGCGEKDTLFYVHVRKNPSIFFFEPPEAVCPGEDYILSFEGLVEYRFYNNEEKVTWTVSPENGGYEFKENTGVNTLKPVILFNTPGAYTFTVELESAGCPQEGDLSLTRPVRVRNSAMTMQANVDDTQVCEDQELLFGMKAETTDNDPLIYSWSVSPTDGNFEFKDYGNDKKIAKLLFKHWGRYEVRGMAIGFCGSLDSVFQITVQKDPKVGLRDTAGICPGIVNMQEYVTYQWFNNVPELTWKVTRVGLNPEAGYEMNDPHAEYPEIHFIEPGEYKVQVDLVSHTLGCDGDSLSAMKTFRVYNPSVIGEIQMIGAGTVTDPGDICEGETVTFINTTNAEGGIQWLWTVEGPEEGYFFEGEAKTSVEREPKLTFVHYGNYVVHVQVVGACKQKEKVFPVQVRGIPRIEFTQQFSNICEGDAIDLHENGYLVYPDAEHGNKNQDDGMTYTWKVSTLSEITQLPVITNPDTNFTSIIFPEHAHYTIQLEIGMKCVPDHKLTLAGEIDVIANDLKAAFTVGKDSVGCVNGAEIYEVELHNQSVGEALQYHWDISTSDGDWQWIEGNEGTVSPRIKLNREGSYRITLHAESCRQDDTTFVLKAFAVPEIRIADITGVCEAFDFRGKEDNRIEIVQHNDAIDSVQWKLIANPGYTSEGYEFINQTSATSLYPDIRFNTCDYTVTVKYWNRCLTPGRDTFRVEVDKFIPITFLQNDSICTQSRELRLLHAEPDTGVWSLSDAALPHASEVLIRKDGGYYFNPLFGPYEEREVELVYTLKNLSCIAEKTMKMQVWPLPWVEAGDSLTMCLNQEPLALIGKDSAATEMWQVNRGYWKYGERELADFHFRPDSAGEVRLSYYYKNKHTCENMDTTVVIVYPLPDTTFIAKDQYCLNTEADFRVESHEKNYFWKYDEEAKVDTLSGSGKHVYDHPGYYNVTLVTESVQGCRDTSAAQRIEIVDVAPPAVFTMSTHRQCGPVVHINVGVEQEDYQDHNLHFEWDFGNGNVADTLLPANPQAYPVGTFDTTYYLKFRVYNICNETRMLDSLIVGSTPVADFHFENGERNCSPLYLQVINASTGSGNQYTWYMGDGKDSLLVYEPKGYLFETGTKTEVFNVSLVATNHCGRDSVMYPLTVMAQTLEAFFDKPKDDICVGEQICFNNYTRDTSRYITYKYWDFGDEVRDTTWNACHTYQDSGYYKVLLFVDNGCTSDTMSKQIRVMALPRLNVGIDSIVCDQSPVHFSFTADQDLQWSQWNLGDDSTVSSQDFSYIYKAPGNYPVLLEAVANNRAFCKAKVEKVITIHPLPDIQVTPFDTLVCPPWTYLPEVNGDTVSLMWNYGDGSDWTSALEHEYVNHTDSILHHQVILQAVSDKGCVKDFIGKIAVANLPVADFRKEVIPGRPQKVNLINQSRDYSECIWYLPQGQVDHTFDDRHLEFKENGVHEFALVAYNQFGCKDSLRMEHEVLIKGLYFPNTFIPHSLNGKINRFNGIGMGLQRYKLEIFDQHKNKIWETRALQDGKPVGGWDGCNNKGEKMPQGVYIWRAEAIFADDEVWTGDNNGLGIPETTQGTVLLLRE